jgi:hypothetical protein
MLQACLYIELRQLGGKLRISVDAIVNSLLETLLIVLVLKSSQYVIDRCRNQITYGNFLVMYLIDCTQDENYTAKDIFSSNILCCTTYQCL